MECVGAFLNLFLWILRQPNTWCDNKKNIEELLTSSRVAGAHFKQYCVLQTTKNLSDELLDIYSSTCRPMHSTITRVKMLATGYLYANMISLYYSGCKWW